MRSIATRLRTAARILTPWHTGFTKLSFGEKPQMFSTFALALMLAMQSNVGASAVFSSYFDGQRYDFHVTQQDIETSPRWLDTDDSPPLPPRVAMQSARTLVWQLANYADK